MKTLLVLSTLLASSAAPQSALADFINFPPAQGGQQPGRGQQGPQQDQRGRQDQRGQQDQRGRQGPQQPGFGQDFGPGDRQGRNGPGFGRPDRGPGSGFGGGGVFQPQPQPAPAPTGAPPGYIAIYRFLGNGAGHFLTSSYQEGISAGFRYEGVAFNVLARPLPGSTALYRCLISGTSLHFTSQDVRCEGYQNEGAYGFVMNQATREESRAIYRCVSSGVDHLTTTNPQECINAGYRVEGAQGFVQ